MQQVRRLSRKEEEELAAVMLQRHPDGPLADSLTALHGFLTCMVVGPLVMPSEWMGVVFGDTDNNPWETIKEAKRGTELLMRFYNTVVNDVGSPEGFSIVVDVVDDDEDDEVEIADDWCVGFLFGTTLRADEWAEALKDPKLQAWLTPIAVLAKEDPELLSPFRDREEYAEVLGGLPDCALRIRSWWRGKLSAEAAGEFAAVLQREPVRRVEPKISPNAACACGSGKKYKRCCSPLRTH